MDKPPRKASAILACLTREQLIRELLDATHWNITHNAVDTAHDQGFAIDTPEWHKIFDSERKHHWEKMFDYWERIIGKAEAEETFLV